MKNSSKMVFFLVFLVGIIASVENTYGLSIGVQYNGTMGSPAAGTDAPVAGSKYLSGVALTVETESPDFVFGLVASVSDVYFGPALTFDYIIAKPIISEHFLWHWGVGVSVGTSTWWNYGTAVDLGARALIGIDILLGSSKKLDLYVQMTYSPFMKIGMNETIGSNFHYWNMPFSLGVRYKL